LLQRGGGKNLARRWHIYLRGWCYANGRGGVKKSSPAAKRLFRYAARKGHFNADRALIIMAQQQANANPHWKERLKDQGVKKTCSVCTQASNREVMVVCDSPRPEHFLHWWCADPLGGKPFFAYRVDRRPKKWWCWDCKKDMPDEWKEQQTLNEREDERKRETPPTPPTPRMQKFHTHYSAECSSSPGPWSSEY
jgi:TPR repeat protein